MYLNMKDETPDHMPSISQWKGLCGCDALVRKCMLLDALCPLV